MSDTHDRIRMRSFGLRAGTVRRGARGALGTLTQALPLAAGVSVWVALFYTHVLAQPGAGPARTLAWVAWDMALLLLPCAALLRLATAAARRLGLQTFDPVSVLARAGLVAILGAALLTPALALRAPTHAWLSPWMPAPPAVAAGDVWFDSDDPALCTIDLTSAAAPASPLPAASATVRAGARDALAAAPLLWLLAALSAAPAALRRRRRSGRARLRVRRLAPVALVAPTIVLMCALPAPGLVGAPAHFTDTCAFPVAPPRVYQVSAIHVDLTLNRFGDHDPGAYMYALDSRIADVRAQESAALPDRVSNGLAGDAIQPLVLRANVGECLVIQLTNQLNDGPVSLHVHGLAHTAANAGSSVGSNPDGFAPAGGSVTYTIPIPHDPAAERAYYFHDHGASRGRVSHGLFGAIVVEPAGSQFLDPETGLPSDGSGWAAIVSRPSAPDFREFVLMYHEIGDERFRGILDATGRDLPQVDDIAGTYRPAARAINYRSEPFRNRLALHFDRSQGYGSYMFGDPATPIPRSYLGEPTKTRLMHGGSEVFHVHHLHGGGDRWRRNPNADPANDISSGLVKRPAQNVFSTHLDSQSIGPGTSYNLEHECGAGGCQQAAGDFLYHCHIGQHYVSGMWGFWRVFDTRQPDLAPLPDHTPPPDPVTSVELVGRVLDDGREVVLPGAGGPGRVEVDALVEPQLPPRGQPFDAEDATVWDWVRVDTVDGPLYLGEAETFASWPNFSSPTPGVRPPILFNPTNGRYAWPLLRPHLGQRPPFAPNGHSGAPWLGEQGSAERPDGLCPNTEVVPELTGQQIRRYPITAIPIAVPVTRTVSDPDGKIFVLGDEKDAVLAGTRPAEPLAIRSSVGDCVDILLTSELPDSDANDFHSKVNIHTHFVQFDPQASDGVITGLSFEQSVRPYAMENRTLAAAAGPGDTAVVVTSTARLRPGIWIGIGLGEGMCGPSNERFCTEVRRIESILGTTLVLDAPLENVHAAGEAVGVEFVRYAWYSDVDTGTVFWHDHVNFRDWDHGLFGAHIVEPEGATFHDPVTGAEVRSGTIVDVRAPATSRVGHDTLGSFREFMVFLHSGSPANGGEESGATINLRAEPLAGRLGEPAHRFSSVLHGDPWTPLPRAYVGDPFVVRGLGVVERVGGLRITGHRFGLERFAPGAQPTDAMHLGISERTDVALEGGAGGGPLAPPAGVPAGHPGDYLYYSTVARHLVSGAWGIVRVLDGAQPDLQPLPGHAPPVGAGTFPAQVAGSGAPAPAADPGDPCPESADLRTYSIELTPAEIVYDPEIGAAPAPPCETFFCDGGGAATPTAYVDPDGIAYVLRTDGGGVPPPPPPEPCDTFLCDDPGGGGGGAAEPVPVEEPLVVRVNAGECLELRLRNSLGVRAGISVGELRFDPQGSYGTAVGLNADSTVPPGEERRYRYYADRELGTALALDLSRPENGARGAFAAVIVEPAGAEYRDPVTGNEIETGIQADIVLPGGARFRELVALFSDEDADIGQSVMPYPSDIGGFAGISYAAEPLEDRDVVVGVSVATTRDDGAASDAFESALHGDPTLLAEVPARTPVTFRVAQPWGEQPHVFSVEGHRFPLEPDVAGSEEVFSRLLVPGLSFDAPLLGGAGGGYGFTGDHLFLDHRQPFLEAGLWGILRVTEAPPPPPPRRSCGLGFELVGLLPAWAWLRRRRRSKVR